VELVGRVGAIDDLIQLAAGFDQQRADRFAVRLGQPVQVAGELEQLVANLLVSWNVSEIHVCAFLIVENGWKT